MRVDKDNIPKGWEIKRIGDYADVTKLAGFEFTNHIEYIDNGEIIALRALNAKDGKLDLSNIKKISKKVSDNLQRSKLFMNDIVFTYVGTIGEVAIINENNRFHLAPNIAKITIKENGNPNFLFQILRSTMVEDEIRKLLTNSSQPALSMGNIRKIKTIFPSLCEQTKIAEILSIWDHAIEGNQKLIDQLELRKKGLMQELLLGKKRLPGFDCEWKEVQLGDISKRVTTKNEELDDTVITISAQRGFVRQEDYFKKRVASSTLSGYYLINKGDFAYNKSYSNGYPMGAIKRLGDFDKAVVTTLYICFSVKDNVDSDYLMNYFEAGLLVRNLSRIAQEGGRAHGLLNIGISDFFDLKLTLPSKDEQVAIAGILNSIHDEIKLHIEKLEQLKSQKKGLMQQLLTGKKRVKIDE